MERASRDDHDRLPRQSLRAAHRDVDDGAFDTTGASIIGTKAAMASAPDGYTMRFGCNQLVTMNRPLFRRLPCDPDRATRLSLVSGARSSCWCPRICRRPRSPNSWLKRRPGTLVLGTSGPDTLAHLSGEILTREAGIQLPHVPHRTTPRNELMAGQVQLCVQPTARHRAGTAAPGRAAHIGDVPRPRGAHPPWSLRPPGMAAEAEADVAAAVAELAADPWLRERMAPLATRLIGEGPAALDAAMERDLALWSGIVRERDIRLD